MRKGIDVSEHNGILDWNTIITNGIDVSEHNGILDWNTIITNGIEFAMIRVGVGSNYESQDDKQAVRNMQECARLGIPYGAYVYGYALTAEDAASEAEHALRMVKDFNPTLGVFIDMEDADGYKVNHSLVPESNGELLTDFCIIFMDKVKEAGYSTGVYANKNYFDNILSLVRFTDYPKWLAIWGPDTCPEGDWTIWQFSSDGEVPGSSDRTDMNYYMKELPTAPVIDAGQVVEEPIREWPIASSLIHEIGEHVFYNTIYYTSGSWEAMTPLNTEGTITQRYEGARNPYLIDGGTGFINDECIISPPEASAETVQIQVITNVPYTILDGDNLSTIASHYGIDYNYLAQYNGITEPDKIWAGTVLNIPVSSTVTAPAGCTPAIMDPNYLSPADRGILETGTNIRIREGATDSNNGATYYSYVFKEDYQVIEDDGTNVIFGVHGRLTGKTAKENVYTV